MYIYIIYVYAYTNFNMGKQDLFQASRSGSTLKNQFIVYHIFRLKKKNHLTYHLTQKKHFTKSNIHNDLKTPKTRKRELPQLDSIY